MVYLDSLTVLFWIGFLVSKSIPAFLDQKNIFCMHIFMLLLRLSFDKIGILGPKITLIAPGPLNKIEIVTNMKILY